MINATIAHAVNETVPVVVANVSANCDKFLSWTNIPTLILSCSWYDTLVNQLVAPRIPLSIIILALLAYLILNAKIEFVRSFGGILKWIIAAIIIVILLFGMGAI
jgi:hypothetical protein